MALHAVVSCTPGVLVACWCTPGEHIYLTLHTKSDLAHRTPLPNRVCTRKIFPISPILSRLGCCCCCCCCCRRCCCRRCCCCCSCEIICEINMIQSILFCRFDALNTNTLLEAKISLYFLRQVVLSVKSSVIEITVSDYSKNRKEYENTDGTNRG